MRSSARWRGASLGCDGPGAAEMTARLFQLKGYEDDFYTGRAGDGCQVLMGLLCPNLVCYFFSSEGVLLAPEVRPWRYPAPGMSGQG